MIVGFSITMSSPVNTARLKNVVFARPKIILLKDVCVRRDREYCLHCSFIIVGHNFIADTSVLVVDFIEIFRDFA